MKIRLSAALAIVLRPPRRGPRLARRKSRCSPPPTRSTSRIQAPLATLIDNGSSAAPCPARWWTPAARACRSPSRCAESPGGPPKSATSRRCASSSRRRRRRRPCSRDRSGSSSSPIAAIIATYPAICAARICGLPDVQSADAAELPRAARERRLSGCERPADRFARRLLHRGSRRRRPAQRPQPRSAPAIAFPLAYLSPPDAARYAMFQHMIANHDWSMRAGPAGDDCCHNAEIDRPLAPGRRSRSPTTSIFPASSTRPMRRPPGELGS